MPGVVAPAVTVTGSAALQLADVGRSFHHSSCTFRGPAQAACVET